MPFHNYDVDMIVDMIRVCFFFYVMTGVTLLYNLQDLSQHRQQHKKPNTKSDYKFKRMNE